MFTLLVQFDEVAMEVAVVFVLSSIAAVSCSKCDLAAPLPKPSAINNMKKITGVWYQTVSSNDYIAGVYICGTISKVVVNTEPEGYSALITKYFRKGKPRPFDVYYRKTAGGYFEEPKFDYREIAAHDFDQYGRLNTNALKEDYGVYFHPGENSIISDGTNFFTYVNCTPEGWAVWIYTPQKVLTTEKLLYIRNELVKNGIHTELRLGQCEDINTE